MNPFDDKSTYIKSGMKDPIILCEALLSEYPALLKVKEEIYEYNGKCYDLITDKRLDRMYYDFCVNHGVTLAWKSVNLVVRALLSSNKITQIAKMNDNPELICFNNGVLNIYNKNFVEHSPEFHFDSYINIDYDPTATDFTVFDSYLRDTFNDDQQTIDNIISLGGYLLDTNNRANKMFMFDGPGGSGKSTLIDTFSLFFSESQITALSLDELASGSFDKEGLITSRVNFTAEQKKGYIDAEEIKKIISGDIMKVSRKFKLACTFRPKTKIIVACNGLPKFTDTSDGIFRRLVVIRFKNQYKSKESIARMKFVEERHIFPKDSELFDKIKLEKSAILNLFLEGLIKLRANKYEFIDSEDSYEALSEFRRDSDTVREFLEENYEIDLTAEYSIHDIYGHYRRWYRDNVQDSSYMKFRVNEMGRRIKEVFGIDSKGQRLCKDKEGNIVRVTVVGLKLKIEEDWTPTEEDNSLGI